MSRSLRSFKLSRVRVGFQIFLHLLIAGHLVAWYLFDFRAVGGLDFQDFFHTFVGSGAVTYAVLFAGGVYLLSLVFGRLFCSWGCHFGATQDLAAWLLRRLGWKPPLVRTRILHWCPFLVLGFVFLWPSFERWLDQGWGLQPIGSRAELVGDPPWERLPGWFLSIVTFAACGAGILLFLGTRGFCRFVCPYGAVFRLTDRIAPYRVRRTEPCTSTCASSGVPPCSRVCPTAIDVHAETERSGAVTSADCVRCNLCIEACPSGALSYAPRFRPLPVLPPGSARGREPGVSGAPSAGADRLRGISGELAVLLVAFATFAASDLVYGGHFLAATIALGEGFLAVLVFRLFRERDVVAGRIRLKQHGRWRLPGVTAVAVFLSTIVLLGQAGAFKLHRWRGLELRRRADALASAPVSADRRTELLRDSAWNLRSALRYFPSRRELRLALVSCYQALDDPRAIEEAGELVRRDPRSVAALETFRRVLIRFGRPGPAGLIEARLSRLREERNALE